MQFHICNFRVDTFFIIWRQIYLTVFHEMLSIFVHTLLFK